MVDLVIILLLPIILNILSNIIATWVEPKLRSSMRFFVFAFIVLSIIGAIYSNYEKVVTTVSLYFRSPNIIVTNSNAHPQSLQNDTTANKSTNDSIKQIPLHNLDTLGHKVESIDTNILVIEKSLLEIDTSTFSGKFRLAISKKASVQPIWMKILGWILLFCPFVLIYFSIRNFKTASNYKYGFWESIFGGENRMNNSHYLSKGYRYIYTAIGLFYFILISSAIFIPSLCAIESAFQIFEIFNKVVNSIYEFFYSLISPFFWWPTK